MIKPLVDPVVITCPMCGGPARKLPPAHWQCANGHGSRYTPTMVHDAAVHLTWKFVGLRIGDTPTRTTIHYGYEFMGRVLEAMLLTHSLEIELLPGHHKYECRWVDRNGGCALPFPSPNLFTAVVVTAARSTGWAWQEATG